MFGVRLTEGVPSSNLCGVAHPVHFGLVGLGGYAAWAYEQVLAEHSAPPSEDYPSIRLATVCEPDQVAHAERITQLRQAGVHVVSNLDELLGDELDAVWLPVPIHLHRSFTERCLARGKAVLVEKPAAGCIEDVDGMIAARDQTGLATAVGFQNLFDPAVWKIKRQLLAGAIGTPRSASVLACWPRSKAYFNRNDWAGKLRRDGIWVLDSPANNAMAHFLNLALFLLGPTESESAIPISVKAELYRANAIENYDTCCIGYQFPSGASMLVALTHACRDTVQPQITIFGDAGALRFSDGRYDFIAGSTISRSITAASQRTPLAFRGFAAHLRGYPLAPIATLEMARAHTLAINAASEASIIHDVPPRKIEVVLGSDGAPMRTIRGIERALMECSQRGLMLHDSGQVDWAKPGGTKNLRNYSHFNGAAQ